MTTTTIETHGGRIIRQADDGYEVQPHGDNIWVAVPTLDDAHRLAAPPKSANRIGELLGLIEEDVAAAQETLASNPQHAAAMMRRVRPMLRELRQLV